MASRLEGAPRFYPAIVNHGLLLGEGEPASELHSKKLRERIFVQFFETPRGFIRIA